MTGEVNWVDKARRFGSAFALAALATLLLGVGSGAGAPEQQPPPPPGPVELGPPPPKAVRSKKVDGRLAQVAARAERHGAADGVAAAKHGGLRTKGDRVLVVVGTGQSTRARQLIGARGGEVTAAHGRQLEALLPVGMINRLAADSAVTRITAPLARPDAITGQGVSATGAARGRRRATTAGE